MAPLSFKCFVNTNVGGGLVCRIKGHPGDLPATYHVESETVTCNIPDGIDKSATCEVYSLKDPLLPPCCTSSIGQDDTLKLSLESAVLQLLSDDLDINKKASSWAGKKVLLRADLNVPTDNGIITDDTRIQAVLPTIRLLLKSGCRVAIASHFGRPEPKKESWEQMRVSHSLGLVAEALALLLGPDLFTCLAPDCVGPKARVMVEALKPGQACLLENTRFHQGEVANDPAFSADLASSFNIFVCDAFGVVHRDQASVTGVTRFIQETYPGLLIRHELRFLMKALVLEPRRPFAVVAGGAKVADKIGVLRSLIPKSDIVIVGGRMAFTFLAAMGVSVGQTQIEAARLEDARSIIELSKAHGVKLFLPVDAKVSESLEEPKNLTVTEFSTTCCTDIDPCVSDGWYGIDIGPKSEEIFADALSQAKTIFLNGPMGKFEVPAFSSGTHSVIQAMAKASREIGATTVIGGGDSVSAVNSLGLAESFSHISTGGGASLELLEGKALPGLVHLIRS